MEIKPTITEAERHELRKRAARSMADRMQPAIGVHTAHLLDLLDCADREATLLEERDELQGVAGYRLEQIDHLKSRMDGTSILSCCDSRTRVNELEAGIARFKRMVMTSQLTGNEQAAAIGLAMDQLFALLKGDDDE